MLDMLGQRGMSLDEGGRSLPLGTLAPRGGGPSLIRRMVYPPSPPRARLSDALLCAGLRSLGAEAAGSWYDGFGWCCSSPPDARVEYDAFEEAGPRRRPDRSAEVCEDA
eukprot:Sspe_Gene.32867::Locus_16089_Transcript_1_1_Confidence_1.000_Length_1109::g.32867::m.32867